MEVTAFAPFLVPNIGGAPGLGGASIAYKAILFPTWGKSTVARTGRPATRQVAAVQRAIAILDELAAARTELGTNEIARRTGINVSTISRILPPPPAAAPVAPAPSPAPHRLAPATPPLA